LDQIEERKETVEWEETSKCKVKMRMRNGEKELNSNRNTVPVLFGRVVLYSATSAPCAFEAQRSTAQHLLEMVKQALNLMHRVDNSV
jgi:hypothetical protein